MISESPRVTTARRQPRPADPSLTQLDRRLTALEDLGDTRGRRFEVARLRQRHGHVVRDQAQRTAGWLTELRNLELAIEREERYRVA